MLMLILMLNYDQMRWAGVALCMLVIYWHPQQFSSSLLQFVATSWQLKAALFAVQAPSQTTLHMGAMGAAPMMKLRQQPGLPTPTTSSWSCLRATAPLWVIGAPCCLGASANASPLPAPCSRWVPLQHLPGVAPETPLHLVPSVGLWGGSLSRFCTQHTSTRCSKGPLPARGPC